MTGSEYLLKTILVLIKILNIPLIAYVMLKVFMDLKSLVSINLNNPVLHEAAGHASHTYVSCARIKFNMKKILFALKEPVPEPPQKYLCPHTLREMTCR